jgi:hypothetical protein
MTASLITGLAVLVAALGAKELVARILGPTADYLGVGMKEEHQFPGQGHSKT